VIAYPILCDKINHLNYNTMIRLKTNPGKVCFFTGSIWFNSY